MGSWEPAHTAARGVGGAGTQHRLGPAAGLDLHVGLPGFTLRLSQVTCKGLCCPGDEQLSEVKQLLPALTAPLCSLGALPLPALGSSSTLKHVPHWLGCTLWDC